MKKRDFFSPAFTMIELVFVIVMLGILTSIAIPKLVATRTDAEYAKAKDTVMTIRTALLIEKQKRMLRGKHEKIIDIGNSTNVFGNFIDSKGDTNVQVLSHAVSDSTQKHKWHFWGTGRNGLHWYGFCIDNSGCRTGSSGIWFQVRNEKFECIENSQATEGKCALLGLDSIREGNLQ